MRKFFARLGTIFNHILSVFAAIAGGALVFATFLVGLSVVTRYFFMKPIGFAQEISEYVLVIMTFFAMAWVLKEEKHVSMDILFHHLKSKTQAFLNVVTSAVSAVLLLVLIYTAANLAVFHYVEGYINFSALAPPKWIFTTVILFGLILLFIQFIRRTVKNFQAWRAEINSNSVER